MTKGYLYIAMGKRYLKEAEISARSLKRFTKYPLCLVTDDNLYQNHLFDEVVLINPASDFVTKILGLVKTPYERTIFLDTDTFVCSSIDNLFSVLDLFDMSLTVDDFMHSYSFFQKFNPQFQLKYEKIIPQYNTGVIAYQWNDRVEKLLHDWLRIHYTMNVKANMPSFREAFIENAASVRISPMPFEYNFHGTKSFGFVYNEIKVVHERFGERWNTLTAFMLSYEQMERRCRHMNKFKGKRIIVPYFGIIPYTFSPYHIKFKIKKMLGIKRTKKAETF